MSMVNDPHRFIFLHVAKTGGRSINLSLKERYGREGVFNTKRLNPEVDRLGRMLGLEAKAFAGDDRWSAYFTFAFVRNPWDRAVSVFEHMRTDYAMGCVHPKGKMSGKARLLMSIGGALGYDPNAVTFEQFVFDVLRDGAVDNYHWDTQSNAVTDGNGTGLFDFLGRFERLQADFDRVTAQVGLEPMKLPHLNKSSRMPWPDYYTPDTMRVVAQVYAEDIDLFGYRPNLGP